MRRLGGKLGSVAGGAGRRDGGRGFTTQKENDQTW